MSRTGHLSGLGRYSTKFKLSNSVKKFTFTFALKFFHVTITLNVLFANSRWVPLGHSPLRSPPPFHSSVTVPFSPFVSLGLSVRYSGSPVSLFLHCDISLLHPPLYSPLSLLTRFCSHHNIFLTSRAGGRVFLTSSHSSFLSSVKNVCKFSFLLSTYSSIRSN